MTTERLVEIIENAGYETREYSGRGMSGAQCLGVTVQKNEILFNAVMASVDKAEERESLLEFFCDGNVEFDSLGQGTIVYFPRVRFNKKEELK